MDSTQPKKLIIMNILDILKKYTDEVTAEVRVSRMAMKFWAMQYAEHITVTSPEGLVNNITNSLHKAVEKYRK